MKNLFSALIIILFLCGFAYPQNESKFAIKKMTPNLVVEDVNATVGFYKDKLGFTTLLTIPDTGKYVFAMLVSDSTTIMFQSVASMKEGFPEYDIKSSANSVILYIDVSDINAVLAKVKAAGVPVLRGIGETFYGTREFVIRDNCGHFVVFAMDIKQ